MLQRLSNRRPRTSVRKSKLANSKSVLRMTRPARTKKKSARLERMSAS